MPATENVQPIRVIHAFRRKWRSSIVPILVVAGLFAGLLREILFAHFYGTSGDVEVLRVAIGLPTILSDSLAASFVSVFIPIFLAERASTNSRRTSDMMHGAMFVSVSVFAVAWLSMPMQAAWFAPGFDQVQTDKLVLTGRVFWILFLFLNVSLIFRGRLSVDGVHWPNASAQLIRSTGIILAMLLGFWLFGELDIAFVAVAAALAGLAVLGVHVFSIPQTERRELFGGLRARVCFRGSRPIVTALMWMMILQLLLSSGRIIDRSLASAFGDGHLAILEYSYALTMAAVAAIGASANILLAPLIGKAIHASGKISADLWRLILMLSVFACVIGLVSSSWAEKIVGLVFTHGQFSAQDMTDTSQIFRIQALALGPLVVSLILLQVLVLRGLLRVVVAFASVKFLVKVGLVTVLFAHGLGFAGLVASFLLTEALSTVLIVWLVIFNERRRTR